MSNIEIFISFVNKYVSNISHTNRISNVQRLILEKCNRLLPGYTNSKYIVHIFTNISSDVYISVRIYIAPISTRGKYIEPSPLPYLDFKYMNELASDSINSFKDWFNIDRGYELVLQKHNFVITDIDYENIHSISTNTDYKTVILRDILSDTNYCDISLRFDNELNKYIIGLLSESYVCGILSKELITWNGLVATKDIINEILNSYTNPSILLRNDNSMLIYKITIK